MKLESDINRENAKELSRLILENPKMSVIAWINSEGISNEYGSWRGDINRVGLMTIAYSAAFERYIEKSDDDYEDCYEFYGADADDWTDDVLNKKAAEIPWDTVIAIDVSAV
jgi:hypothetical protein